MTRQINYIIHAMLLVSTAGIILHLAGKIPSAPHVEKKDDFFCGTASRTSTGFSPIAAKGKIIFMNKCSACHSVNKTDAYLMGFENRGPWSNRDSLYEWIKDPATFMKTNAYTRQLKERSGAMMTSFPDITREEVDAIAEFLIASNTSRVID